MQPYISNEIADQNISSESADNRRRGAAIVALQLQNSRIFSSLFWWTVIIDAAISIWLRSWWPSMICVALLALIYSAIFPLNAFRISRYGVLPEYQAAYKRLYYRDSEFKQQVDAIQRKLSDK